MNTNKKSITITYNVIFYTIIATILLFLNFNFVKTCDDINFITMAQERNWKAVAESALTMGNGRFIGNFLTYLVGIDKLIIAEKTVVWFVLILAAKYFIKSNSFIVNTLLAAVLIFPSDSIFAQNFGWNAGFQIYTVSIAIILIDILIIKESKNINNKALSIVLYLFLILSSFLGQFFAENSSLFAVLSAIILIIESKKRGNVKFLYSLTYFFTTAVGFGLMMVLPKVFGTYSKIAYYRKYPTDLKSLFQIFNKNLIIISRDAGKYFVLWFIVSAGCLLTIKKIREISSEKKFDTLFQLLKLVIIIYPFFSFSYAVIFKIGMAFPSAYLSIILRAAFVIYIICVLSVNFICLFGKKFKNLDKTPYLCALAGLLATAPLLFVSPIGARLFFLPFICLLFSGVIELKEETEKREKDLTFTKLLSVCLILAVSAPLCLAVRDNRFAYSVRENYIKTQISEGETDLTLPLLPNENIVHEDENVTAWQNYFSTFTDKDINYQFITWNDWYAKYYK